jgi:signal transduction histidine kinase
MDYRLGKRDGIQLTRDFVRQGFRSPIIFLTGIGNHDVDIQAMKEGAKDFLEKANLRPELLERSIRYAVDHSKTLAALRETQKQLRFLSAKLLETQENERKLIARELHDSVGANLTAIKYGLEEKGLRMAKDNSNEGIPLDQIISIVTDSIEEIQRISSDLTPPALDDIGILAAIQSLCREFQEVYKGIQIETRINIREEEVRETLKIIIYRIMQEALNNVFKHSGADTVRVALRKTGHLLELYIKDNGHGFEMKDTSSPEDQTGGMGLLSMTERTELSNGELEILSEKGRGTVIMARWPLD